VDGDLWGVPHPVQQVRRAAQRVAACGRRSGRPPGFTQDPGRPMIVIDKFPPYVNTDEVIVSIAERAQGHAWHARHPELGALTALSVKDVEDLTSARSGYWFTCLSSGGTAPEVLGAQLLKVHGVSIYITTQLPRPLPTLIRIWASTNHDEDLPGSLTASCNCQQVSSISGCRAREFSVRKR